MKYLLPLLVGLSLAGCVSAPAPRPTPVPERTAAAFPPRPALDKRGLEGIIGKDAGALKRLFGEPRLDVVEVYGRKLQFAGKACVLDAFLYPEGKGNAELVAPRIADLLALDDAGFRALFSGSPIKRIGRDRFVRNVLIAAGNGGDATMLAQILLLLDDAAPIVRGAAIWALSRLSPPDFAQAKAARAAIEADPDVQAEWQLA